MVFPFIVHFLREFESQIERVTDLKAIHFTDVFLNDSMLSNCNIYWIRALIVMIKADISCKEEASTSPLFLFYTNEIEISFFTEEYIIYRYIFPYSKNEKIMKMLLLSSRRLGDHWIFFTPETRRPSILSSSVECLCSRYRENTHRE